MENFNRVLQTVFYIIWIPIGVVILAGILFMIIFNPIGRFMQQNPFGNYGGIMQSGGNQPFDQQQMPGGQQNSQMMEQNQSQTMPGTSNSQNQAQ